MKCFIAFALVSCSAVGSAAPDAASLDHAREEARTLLADDFRSLNAGRMTLLELAERVAEWSKALRQQLSDDPASRLPIPSVSTTTLLAKLAERETGVDQAAWFRFFELYHPVMVEFARTKGAGDDAEDVVQEVFASLAKAFQSGRYAREKGNFRAYLAKMLRNELISRFRRCSVRPERDAVGITEAEVEVEKRLQTVPSVYSGPDDEENWKVARHRIAVEHVLTKTALSEQSRQIYRRLMESGDNCAAVARAMDIAATTVRQVKSRVTRMIAAFEKTLG